MSSTADFPLLQVNNLHTYFFTRHGVVKAVNGVSFSLGSGRILGIVGESGSGKSVTAQSFMRLVRSPGRIVEGEVCFNGRNLLDLTDEEMRQVRGKEISMIFENPTSALNPILPIGVQLEEMFTSHLNISAKEVRNLMMETLHKLGLPEPEKLIHRYPFQMSGGMCQRIMIAIAMALHPKLLIADEPTSNLDATVQAQILDEIKRLRDDSGSSIILITHSLGVVAKMVEEVAVMYAGSFVEYADVKSLFQRPAHPYTWGLLSSLPRLDSEDRPLKILKGTPPSLVDLPDQCAFIPRCPKALNQCRNSLRPGLESIADNHRVACYNPVRHDW